MIQSQVETLPSKPEFDPAAMKIEIFDTTLRDGAQSLPQENQFPEGSKVELAELIVSQGVDVIEAGFPASMGDEEEIAEVARTVGQTQYQILPKSIENGNWVDLPPKIWTPVITGLTLANPAGIEQAARAVEEADRPGIHVFIATAEEHMRAKHPAMTREEVLEMGVDSIRRARDAIGPDGTVEFSCEAASTTDMVFLERAVRTALQEDINVINLPDTLGAASPIRMAKIFDAATNWMIDEGRVEEITISSHNHDDGQRAVQNTISSMHAVINAALARSSAIPDFQVESVSAPGKGERNGNMYLAPYVRNVLTDRDEFAAPVVITVDTTKLKAVAEGLLDAAGLELDPDTPVTGFHTIVHRSGVHSDAINKGGAATYAAVDNRGFGHPVAAILEDGKYQGKAGRANLGGTDIYKSELVINSEETVKRLTDLAFDVAKLDIEQIVINSNTVSKTRKQPITDLEIEAFALEQLFHGQDDAIKMTDSELHAKSHGKENDDYAKITLNIDGKRRTEKATSNKGEVDAARIAIGKILDFSGDIEDAKPFALHSGSDSEAGAIVKVAYKGVTVTAYSEGTSLNNATIHAYIKAVNLIKRAEWRHQREIHKRSMTKMFQSSYYK